MIKPSDIEAMTVEERLRAMEMLWDSLSRSGVEPPSPEWHGKVLSSRLEKLKSGKAEILTIEQVKPRLSKRRS